MMVVDAVTVAEVVVVPWHKPIFIHSQPATPHFLNDLHIQ
jgi:hypothetical protein